MEGKINKNGMLVINRAGKEKIQCCQFQVNPEAAEYCGDHCPHFNELEDDGISTPLHSVFYIGICHGKRIEFRQFEDERDYEKEIKK